MTDSRPAMAQANFQSARVRNAAAVGAFDSQDAAIVYGEGRLGRFVEGSHRSFCYSRVRLWEA